MNLLRATGILVPPTDADMAGAPWERLVAEAVAFRRGGGVVSLRDWAELQSCEREALVEAYRVVMSEQAAAIGYATLGVDAAAAVAAPADGGEAQKDLAMSRALRAVVDRAQGSSAPAEGRP